MHQTGEEYRVVCVLIECERELDWFPYGCLLAYSYRSSSPIHSKASLWTESFPLLKRTVVLNSLSFRRMKEEDDDDEDDEEEVPLLGCCGCLPLPLDC